MKRAGTVVATMLGACTPRTEPVGQIDTDEFQDSELGGDSASVTADEGADDEPDTVTVGYTPGCPMELPTPDELTTFSFLPVDGSAPSNGTAECTVVAGTSYELDCIGELSGRYRFEFSGSTPDVLFGAGTVIDVTHRAAGSSAWLRFAKDGYTMIVVQADRLAPAGVSIDTWLPGVYAGVLDEAFCEAVLACDDDDGNVEHVGIWLSDTPDGSGPTAVSVFAGESAQIGGDTYFEILVENAHKGACGLAPDDPTPLWVVYQFEGPFPI